LLYLSTKKVIKLTVILSFFPLGELRMQMKLLGITSVDFDAISQRLIKFSISGRYWGKKSEYNGTVHQLFIAFKKAYGSVRREVLYSILTEFGIPRKLDGLIKYV
jgi:hypothetical protein